MSTRPRNPVEPAGRSSEPDVGTTSPTAEDGLSIDKLAQAFAAMMGAADPYAQPTEAAVVDASPVLDDDAFGTDGEAGTCQVSPATIFEAMLFVGLPGGEAITSRRVAGLMRGVRPQEIDDIAAELRKRYRADNCPYEVAAKDSGWVMRLRPEFARFGRVVESRTRMVRLDAEALDVLALVAWNQPVARDKIVELGCDARPSVWRQLVRRGLLELVHEGPESTEPVYRTTRKFLEIFRLQSIDDLPAPTAPPR